MKGYMLNAKAQKVADKILSKGKMTPEEIDKKMMNLLLDGDAKEIPMNEEMSSFIVEHRKKGWKMLSVPENDAEQKLLFNALQSKGMKVTFKGVK